VRRIQQLSQETFDHECVIPNSRTDFVQLVALNWNDAISEARVKRYSVHSTVYSWRFRCRVGKAVKLESLYAAD
jgi:hypothetical protein